METIKYTDEYFRKYAPKKKGEITKNYLENRGI